MSTYDNLNISQSTKNLDFNRCSTTLLYELIGLSDFVGKMPSASPLAFKIRFVIVMLGNTDQNRGFWCFEICLNCHRGTNEGIMDSSGHGRDDADIFRPI